MKLEKIELFVIAGLILILGFIIFTKYIHKPAQESLQEKTEFVGSGPYGELPRPTSILNP